MALICSTLKHKILKSQPSSQQETEPESFCSTGSSYRADVDVNSLAVFEKISCNEKHKVYVLF